MKTTPNPALTGTNPGCTQHQLSPEQIKCALCILASKVARKVEEHYFTKRGTITDEITGESRDTFPENLREAQRADAFSAASIALYSLPEQRRKAIIRRLSRGGKSRAMLKLYRPAFREAQKEFRKMNHEKRMELTAWHENLALLDSPEKDPLAAQWDRAALAAHTAERLKKLKASIHGVRAWHAHNPSRQTASALRADVARIARCARYYFRGMMLGEGFDFAEMLRPGGNGGWRLNDSYRRTFDRADLGLSLRPVIA